MHAQEQGAINPKPLCATVVMRMREIFLLQSKYRVAKMYKNTCPTVDLSNFLSQNKCRVGKVWKAVTALSEHFSLFAVVH